MDFDKDACYAAIDELRPICRTVFTLHVWWEMCHAEIVAYFANHYGIRLTMDEVVEHVRVATAHCLRRLREVGEKRQLEGVPSHRTIAVRDQHGARGADSTESR
jgi:hypothetical protein